MMQMLMIIMMTTNTMMMMMSVMDRTLSWMDRNYSKLTFYFMLCKSGVVTVLLLLAFPRLLRSVWILWLPFP